jgi:predicted metalloprotease
VASRLLRASAVGILGVAVALTACSPTFAQVPAPASVRSDTGPAAMQQDEQFAVQAVDTFWQRHFQEHFGSPYRSPRVVGGYNGNGGPACAGEPAAPFNAFYCLPQDFIAWDDQLMSAGYRQIGDAWVYLIIAHEWAHAIQARLDRDRVSVAAELQADCLAGATLQGAARDGLLTIEPGDAEEMLNTLQAVADDYPWTNQSDHGNARQRIDAFNTGVRGGVPACT